MKGYIRCSANVFGDFSEFEINSKSILELMDILKDYEIIPNVVDEFQIEIMNNVPTQKVVKRLQLISTKKRLIINLSKSNIIVEADPQIDRDSDTAQINIKEFILEAKNIINSLIKIVGKVGNRISLVTTYLDETDISNKFEKYAKPNELFIGKDVFEWNVRSVIRENVDISNNTETLNVISNIYRSKGFVGSNFPIPSNNQFDGVLYEIDINTIPENVKQRINNDFINSFYDIALSFKEKIEGMIKDEEQ